MKEKRNAAPVLQHRDGKGKTAGTSTIVSASDSSMNTARTQDAQRMKLPILDYLSEGATAAITAAELAQITGWRPRQIRREIQRARLHGAPICSSCGVNPGYYLTDDPGELQRYIGALSHREKEIAATRTALIVTRDRMSGQARMEDF